MAIIGFIVLVLIGLYFAAQAVGGALLSLAFSGKFPWGFSGVCGAIAFGLWYVAFTNIPFSVTFS